MLFNYLKSLLKIFLSTTSGIKDDGLRNSFRKPIFIWKQISENSFFFLIIWKQIWKTDFSILKTVLKNKFLLFENVFLYFENSFEKQIFIFEKQIFIFENWFFTFKNRFEIQIFIFWKQFWKIDFLLFENRFGNRFFLLKIGLK